MQTRLCSPTGLWTDTTFNTLQFIPESLKHLPQACSELGSEHHVGILMLLSFFRERDIQGRTSETYRTFHHLRLASPVHRGWNTSLQHGANRLIY